MSGTAEDTRKAMWAAAATALVLVAAACGGGGGSDVAFSTGESEASTIPDSRRTTLTRPGSTTVTSASGGTGTTGTRSGTAPGTTATTASGVTPGVTTTVSPFRRRDVPPGGSDGLFVLSLPTSIAPCGNAPPSEPSVTVPSEVELLQRVDICVLGFAGGDPVEVTLTAPGGQVRRLGAAQRSTPNSHVLTWAVMPTDPLGAYRVRASRRPLEASKTFTLKRASSPRAIMLPPTSQAVGGTFRIAMAGYGARTTVFPSLFVDESFRHRYLSELSPVVMDSAGQGLLTVETRAGDPPGSYCVAFRRSASAIPGPCDVSFSLTP